MKSDLDRSHRLWLLAAFASLAAALLMVSLLVLWGVSRDLLQVRETLTDSEMNRLRTHATRTVTYIQEYLRKEDDPTAIQRVQGYDWLRKNWSRFVTPDQSRLYAAIVDPRQRIVLHSDPAREGPTLEPNWYDRSVAEAGDDVVDTHSTTLTGGRRALDVRVPIEIDDKPVGYYHSGLSYDWLDREMAERREAILTTWAWISAGIIVLISFAGLCLFQISRRMVFLREAVVLMRMRRFAELGQLVAGLAHEIRNPLNAIMLNNHVVGRFLTQLGRDEQYRESATEQALIMKETTQEIERVEGMLRMLLGYARPAESHLERLDVGQEVRSVLVFLKTSLDRADVMIKAKAPEQVAWVEFDRDRLRQILLNLVSNAKDAVGAGGVIDIEVRPGPEAIEVSVADNGPGVPSADRERVFEPFFTTKETGAGLGLALVRRYLEESGGSIACESNEPRGARFRVRLPQTPPPKPAVTNGVAVP
jgi:signal transduction histidine kinase